MISMYAEDWNTSFIEKFFSFSISLVSAIIIQSNIAEYPGLFDEFKVQKILDQWDKFPGIMWGLGFELDYYHSFEVYRKQSNLKLKPPHSKREERRNLLYLLEHADRQIVGNFLFSEWRKYVKCELSYDQFDLDFIFRVMDILESRYI